MATAKRELSDTQVQGPRVLDGADRTTPRGQLHEAVTGDQATRSQQQLRQAATKAAATMRASQGLPPKIDDAATISRLAALLQPQVDD